MYAGAQQQQRTLSCSISTAACSSHDLAWKGGTSDGWRGGVTIFSNDGGNIGWRNERKRRRRSVMA